MSPWNLWNAKIKYKTTFRLLKLLIGTIDTKYEANIAIIILIILISVDKKKIILYFIYRKNIKRGNVSYTFELWHIYIECIF